MIIELFMWKWKKKKQKNKNEQNRNVHICFSQLLYGIGVLWGHFLQQNNKGFRCISFLSHFAVVFRGLLPYLKHRQPFWNLPHSYIESTTVHSDTLYSRLETPPNEQMMISEVPEVFIIRRFHFIASCTLSKLQLLTV